jgi:endonuclease/exonuclease/phosphatase family metal-dependent hydrolase
MKSKLLILFLLVSSLNFAQNPHFWDGIEAFDGPTDENPVLAAQIDFYFDKMVAPLPDSITLEIGRLVERTSFNPNLRDFILWHLLEKYRHPEYMTQDQVFVWLYDNYFSQLEIKDLHETNLALIRDKAERFRRLALFNVAPSLGEIADLPSIESEYTVLFFYDHDCEVCQQEMRDLDSVCALHPEIMPLKIDLNSDTEGLDAIYDAYDIETTPLIYVLDRDKRIIAKKIRARQISLVVLGQNQRQVQVMSYNVRHCAGMDMVLDYDRTAAVISKQQPDVVALQELDSVTGRSGHRYQLAELASRTQYHSIFGSAIDYDGGKYGVGMLTRESPISVKCIPLPGEEPRVLLVVELKDYVIACTHLDLEEEQRLASVPLIVAEAQRWQKPFILAGDWNDSLDSPLMQEMKKHFTILSGDEPTFPADEPQECIDYVASFKGRSVMVLKSSVIDEPEASDHRPLVVSVMLQF